MKTFVTVLVLALVLLLPALTLAQVAGGTGKLGFQLRNYGAIRLNTPVYSGGLRQMDRMSLAAALDSAHVYDHEQDANTVEAASLTTGVVADTVATVLADNTSTNSPPNIQVRTTVYAWHNDSFVIVKFTVKNIDTTGHTYPLFLGAFVVPKPDNLYGGETMTYDTTKKVAYFYRTAGTAYVGFKVLSGSPYSFHPLDWDTYSPDPGSDLASDTMRYVMTARPGFDAAVVAGSDGGALNVNAGLRTIAPHDSVSVYYALIYTESLSAMLLQADSAQYRYDHTTFTGVRQTSRAIPEQFVLKQNYPNPFNPGTRIDFEMKNAAFATLRVYNLLGQVVATLLRERLEAGSYNVEFNGANLPSGVYLYKLTAGNYVQTRRMTLIR